MGRKYIIQEFGGETDKATLRAKMRRGLPNCPVFNDWEVVPGLTLNGDNVWMTAVAINPSMVAMDGFSMGTMSRARFRYVGHSDLMHEYTLSFVSSARIEKIAQPDEVCTLSDILCRLLEVPGAHGTVKLSISLDDKKMDGMYDVTSQLDPSMIGRRIECIEASARIDKSGADMTACANLLQHFGYRGASYATPPKEYYLTYGVGDPCKVWIEVCIDSEGLKRVWCMSVQFDLTSPRPLGPAEKHFDAPSLQNYLLTTLGQAKVKLNEYDFGDHICDMEGIEVPVMALLELFEFDTNNLPVHDAQALYNEVVRRKDTKVNEFRAKYAPKSWRSTLLSWVGWGA